MTWDMPLCLLKNTYKAVLYYEVMGLSNVHTDWLHGQVEDIFLDLAVSPIELNGTCFTLYTLRRTVL